jgi:C1A family cysteine protease
VILSALTASPDDDRDYPYPVREAFPPSSDLRPFTGAVEHQYQLGSCTANAVVSACELILQRRKQFADLSRLFNYYLSRELSGMLASQGAYLRDAVKVARNAGLPLERTWPYETDKETRKPVSEAYDEAKDAKLTRFERIPDDNLLNGIKSALSEGLPVVIGTPVSAEFLNLHQPLAQQNYHGTQGQIIGNHAMCVVGYTPEYLIVENSWGSAWGDQGYGAISNDAVPEIFEAWAIRDFAPDWKVPLKEKAQVWWERNEDKVVFPLMALAFAAMVGIGKYFA